MGVTPRTVMPTTERVFQKQVEAYLKLRGFLVYHTYDSRRSAGGFPDIVAVHAHRRLLLFLELKTVRGKVSPAQYDWLTALESIEQRFGETISFKLGEPAPATIHVRVLRPTREDWAWLEAVYT